MSARYLLMSTIFSVSFAFADTNCSVTYDSGFWGVAHNSEPNVACAMARTYARGPASQGETSGEQVSMVKTRDLPGHKLKCQQGELPVHNNPSVRNAVEEAGKRKWTHCSLGE